MTDTSTIQMVASAAVALVSGASGVLGSMYWMRYWARRTDKRLDGLESKVDDIRISTAVMASQKAHTNGSLEQIQNSIKATDKSVGRNEGAIDKLWDTLQKQPSIDLPPRLSDQ